MAVKPPDFDVRLQIKIRPLKFGRAGSALLSAEEWRQSLADDDPDGIKNKEQGTHSTHSTCTSEKKQGGEGEAGLCFDFLLHLNLTL